MQQRTVLIGDIHGCHDELMDLLKKVNLQPEDRLITLGDSIVKGPKPLEVMRFLLGRPRTDNLLGNMEWGLMRGIERRKRDRLPRAHVEAYERLKTAWDEIEPALLTWPVSLDLGDYICVHAGVHPARKLRKQKKRDLLHLRRVKVKGKDGPAESRPWWEFYQGPPVVIFGHSVLPAPLVTEWAIGLDTGCVYGGHLTALVLPERKIVQVPARAVYHRSAPQGFEANREIA